MKSILIEQFSKWLLGGTLWERIKRLVSRVNDSNLSGAAKRAAVIAEAEAIGLDLASFMLNAGIELAVVYLRNKSSN